MKARIEELSVDKQTAQAALDAIPLGEVKGEDNSLPERLARIPDLTQQLRDATPEIKRLVFQAFELRVEFDKAQRHIAISATVTEAVARALRMRKTCTPRTSYLQNLFPLAAEQKRDGSTYRRPFIASKKSGT